jgi:dihydroorotase
MKEEQLSPMSLSFGKSTVTPLRAGETLAWRVETAG